MLWPPAATQTIGIGFSFGLLKCSLPCVIGKFARLHFRPFHGENDFVASTKRSAEATKSFSPCCVQTIFGSNSNFTS